MPTLVSGHSVSKLSVLSCPLHRESLLFALMLNCLLSPWRFFFGRKDEHDPVPSPFLTSFLRARSFVDFFVERSLTPGVPCVSTRPLWVRNRLLFSKDVSIGSVRLSSSAMPKRETKTSFVKPYLSLAQSSIGRNIYLSQEARCSFSEWHLLRYCTLYVLENLFLVRPCPQQSMVLHD